MSQQALKSLLLVVLLASLLGYHQADACGLTREQARIHLARIYAYYPDLRYEQQGTQGQYGQNQQGLNQQGLNQYGQQGLIPNQGQIIPNQGQIIPNQG